MRADIHCRWKHNFTTIYQLSPLNIEILIIHKNIIMFSWMIKSVFKFNNKKQRWEALKLEIFSKHDEYKQWIVYLKK